MRTHRRLLMLCSLVIGGGLAGLATPSNLAAEELFCTGGDVLICPEDGQAWCNAGSGPNCVYLGCSAWGGGSGSLPYFVFCGPA